MLQIFKFKELTANEVTNKVTEEIFDGLSDKPIEIQSAVLSKLLYVMTAARIAEIEKAEKYLQNLKDDLEVLRSL